MIIDKEELEVWMISLLECDRMTPVRERATESWEDQGIKVNLFSAYTPDTMPNFLNLKPYKNKKGGQVSMSPTEQAIWYSHFYLWKKAKELNKPICIIEEDCELISSFPNNFEVYNLISFCYNTLGLLTPAAGYTITPTAAKKLYNIAVSEIMDYNIDHLLLKYNDNYDINYPEKIKKNIRLARQVPIQERKSNSIKHW